MTALESTLPAMFTRVLASKSSAALTLRKTSLLQSLLEEYQCQAADVTVVFNSTIIFKVGKYYNRFLKLKIIPQDDVISVTNKWAH